MRFDPAEGHTKPTPALQFQAFHELLKDVTGNLINALTAQRMLDIVGAINLHEAICKTLQIDCDPAGVVLINNLG
jgi:hypothetical protein